MADSDMDILYIANARLPTEKAHGVAMMKACQAFIRAGCHVRLVVARRQNAIAQSAHEYYAISEQFPVRRLPSFDLIGTGFPAAPYLQALTFYISLFAWACFQSRKQIVYTRDVGACLLKFLGYTVIFECHMIPKKRRLLFFLVRYAKKVVAVSHTLRAILVEAGFPSERILVVPNAVDLAVFDIPMEKTAARSRLGLPDDAHILVYTGNFTTHGEDKGLLDIFRALKLLGEQYLFIAVGGSDSDLTRYQALAREEGVEKEIRLVAHVQQSELAVYQKAADVLLMPFPDTPYYRAHMSPIKMFEYMASKRPIIASDLPTIREVLDASMAALIPPDTSEALAKAVREVCDDPEKYEAYASAAYQKAAATYTWEHRAASIVAWLKG